MTLIIGLKTDNCVVIGAEQEEAAGYASKRVVSKLKLMTGKNWAVVVGGAGDAALAERAMRSMEKKLHTHQSLAEQTLLDITDEILEPIFTKYIDKDKDSDGLSLVIGAVCDNELLLFSTSKRVTQPQDSIAYAGLGAHIDIFF